MKFIELVVTKIKKVGKIKDLPPNEYYSGTFDNNGTMYIGGTNVATDKIYALDLIRGEVIKTITLNKKLNMYDFGIIDDKYIYVVPPQSFLHKIDIDTGEVTILKADYTFNDVKKYTFDAFYSDVEGKNIC